MKFIKKIKKILYIIIIIIAIGIYFDRTIVNVPVLFYHRVNNTDNVKDRLNIPPKAFEMQIKWLYDHHYNSIDNKQLLKFYEKKEKLPKNPVMITFDDGYIDNYLYAFPILKKYNMKAIIFIETSRINNLKELRTKENTKIIEYNKANYEAAKNLLKGKTTKHFLSWNECQEMVNSGLITIASHSHFHKELFTSNKIDHFYNKFDHWDTIIATDNDERKGIPIFKRISSMAARKFNDNKEIRDLLVEKYNSLFNKSENEKQKILMNEYNKLVKTMKKGEFETEKQQTERFIYEFKTSKNLIENNLNVNCISFCWPWGKYTSKSLEIGKKQGYKLFFTTKLGTNSIYDSQYEINRFKIFSISKLWFSSRMFLHSHYPLIFVYKYLHRNK